MIPFSFSLPKRQEKEARRLLERLRASPAAASMEVEGDLQPVFCMGVLVVYIRKFDSRLQIEMLRDRKGKADR